jgi:hypothetical protein
MDASTIARVVSLIPERIARVQSGSVFTPEQACASRYPERLALIMQKLDWLTPLTFLTKDEQRDLGLLSANGRLMHSSEQEELDIESAEELSMEAMEEERIELTTEV